MSAFPITVEPSPRTSKVPDSGKRTSLTYGGGLRGRNTFNQTYFMMTWIDENLSASEVASVEAHHDADPDSEHTRTVDGVSYTFTYLNRPYVTEYHGEWRTLQTQVRAHL